MLPNGIGDFFLVPPEDNAHRILSLTLPLLHHWSNQQKPIGAQAITSLYLAAFQANGFELQESRLWMIRPTGNTGSKMVTRLGITPCKRCACA